MTQRRDSVFINRIENEPGDMGVEKPTRNLRLAKILALMSELLLLEGGNDIE